MRAPRITIALGLALALGACSSDAGEPGSNVVTIRAVSFEPAAITVEPGTTVTWDNTDDFDHTVTAGDPGAPHPEAFDGELGGGGTFARTFDEPGTVPYFCRIHPQNMQGTVKVE